MCCFKILFLFNITLVCENQNPLAEKKKKNWAVYPLLKSYDKIIGKTWAISV